MFETKTSSIPSISLSPKSHYAVPLIISAAVCALIGFLVRKAYEAAPANMLGEFGPLEISQALALILTCLSGLLVLIFAKQAPVGHPYQRIHYAFGAGALLAFSFLLREVDVELLPLPQPLIVLGSGIGRNILLSVLWLITLILFLLNRELFFKQTLYIIKRPVMTYFLIGGAFLLTGALFDKNIIDIESGELWEETTELIGFALIAIGAIADLITHRKKS